MSAPAHLPHPADDRDTALAAAWIWAVVTGMNALAMTVPGFNLLDVAAVMLTLWAAIGTTNYVVRTGPVDWDRVRALCIVVVYSLVAAMALLAAGGAR